MRLLRFTRIAFNFLVAPFVVLVAVILLVDFFGLASQLITGNYAPTIGQDIGFYLVFIPAILCAMGVRQLRRLL